MKYITWKLKWQGNYGTGPESQIAELGGNASASAWATPVQTGEILGYLTGEVDLSLLAEFEVRELSQIEALEFAKQIDQNAFIMPDGFIGTTSLSEQDLYND